MPSWASPFDAAEDPRLGAARINAASRERGEALVGAEASNRADIIAGNVRGSGTLTKYRPVGGWQTPGPGAGGGGGNAPGSRLAAPASEFGEPTSYAGGAGAPAPAEVIRGMRLSYTNPAPEAPGGGYNPTPGTGTREFATPLEAGQAFNRGQRGAFLAGHPVNPNVTYPAGASPEERATGKFGEWRPSGQTLAETPAREIPGHAEAWKAQADLYREQKKGVEATNRKTDIATNQAVLRKQLEEEIGVQDSKTGNYSLPTDPAIQAVHKKMDRLTLQGVSPEEAYKAVAPELHKYYYTPENIYGAIGLMEKQTGRPLPPELRQQLMSGSLEAMETLYPFTRQAAQQPRGVISRTFSPAPPIQPNAAPGTNLLQSSDFVAP